MSGYGLNMMCKYEIVVEQAIKISKLERLSLK